MPIDDDFPGTTVADDQFPGTAVAHHDDNFPGQTISKEQRLQAFDATNANTYDPRPDLGTPSALGGPDEGWTQYLLQAPAKAMGAVLGATQRGVATGIQNIIAPLASKNEAELNQNLVGVKPDKNDVAGTVGQFIAAPFKAALNMGPSGSFEGQREALGFKGLPTRSSYWKPNEADPSNPTFDYGEFARHAAQGTIDLIGNTLQDPLFWTHPGMTSAGKEAHAARINEIVARAKGTDRGEQFLARDFTTPPTADRLNEIGAQIRLPGLKPIDVAVPEFMRPAAKVYDALNARLQKAEAGNGDWLNKLGGIGRFFSEPSSTSVEGFAQNTANNLAVKYAQEQLFTRLAARKKGFDELGFTPAQRSAVAFAGELGDPDLPNMVIRATGEAAERLKALDFNVMENFEGELTAHLETLVKNGDLTKEQLSGELAAGMKAFKDQANFVADEFLKMTPDQRAYAYDSANAFRQMGKSVRQDVATRFGVELPELGGKFRSQPIETLEKIELLRQKIDQAKSGEYTQAWEEAGKVKPLPVEADASVDYTALERKLQMARRDTSEAGKARVKELGLLRNKALKGRLSEADRDVLSEMELRKPPAPEGQSSTGTTLMAEEQNASQRGVERPEQGYFDETTPIQGVSEETPIAPSMQPENLRNEARDTRPDAGPFPAKQPRFTDQVSEWEAERAKLLAELPAQLRRRVAVPSYFPGRVSAEGEAAMFKGNANLREPGASSGVETAQRRFVHGKTMGDEALEGVPMTTFQTAQEIARGAGGTLSTAGRAVADAKAILEGSSPTLADRFLTKIGFKDAQDFYNPQSFLKADPVEAWARYLGRDLFKPVRNAEVDGIYQRSVKTVNTDAYRAVQDAARHGVPSDVPGMTQEPTFEQLKNIYRRAGGEGTLQELMSPETLDRVGKGEMTLADAFKAEQPPHGMSLTELNGQKVWMNEGIARELQEWKQLGNDPQRFGAIARNIGPYYQTWLGLWRKGATQAGPQFIAYNLRNALGDAIRLMQKGVTPEAAYETFKLLKPTWSYLKTGDVASFAGRQVDLGHLGVMDGAEFADLAMEKGILASGQMRADIMEGAKEAWLKARKNTGANILQKADDAWEFVKSLTAAREDAQRLAAFQHFIKTGLSPDMAAMRVEDALFNMKRLSPAADFARKTGIAPFVWPFKNIPFQLRFAMENPGVFSAIIRGLGMIENGDMTDDMLPKWMKNKFNYVLGSRKEPNGHIVHTVYTDDGVNPITDFTQLAHAVNQGDGLAWLQQNVGPMFQMAANVVEHNMQNEARQGEGVDYSPLLGRPQTSWNKALDTFRDSRDKFGEQKGVVRRLGDLTLNPFQVHDVDVTKQTQVSVNSAKAALHGYQGQLKNAQRDFDAALDQANAEQANMNMAQLLGTEGQFANLQQRVDRARQGVERARKIRDRVRTETQKALARAEQLSLAN